MIQCTIYAQNVRKSKPKDKNMRLTELLYQKRLRVSHIAAQAGVHHSILSKLLRGLTQPSARTIRALIAAYPELTEQDILADYFDAVNRKDAA